MSTIRFEVDTIDSSGKICVKQLNGKEEGDNVVVVNMDDKGAVISTKREAPVVAASPATETISNTNLPGALSVDGGFSMKSLTGKLFGTKRRFVKKSFKKHRSVRKSRGSIRRHRSGKKSRYVRSIKIK
jgi:hypothetical protein